MLEKPAWLVEHLARVKGDPSYLPDGRKKVVVFDRGDGTENVVYAAWPKQLTLHADTTPNFILEGERGTGKSHSLRWDCHLSALAYPGYKYLILRRTMPELRKSHLLFIGREMDQLGGRALGVRSGNTEAHYSNGSIGLFGHCETAADIEKYLSAEFYKMVFDEIVTFDWEMFTKIATSCRVPEGSGLIAMVRGGTNPLGVSAEEVHRYFIARDVTPDEDPEYMQADWGALHMTMDDNPSLDKDQYLKRFAGLPEAYRKAWLQGEWGVEGAYFDIRVEHTVSELPKIPAFGSMRPMLEWPWLHIYRILDWGWHDPTACLWVAVLPDGHEVPFREQLWTRTPVQSVAYDIRQASEGMHVVTTLADPTIWAGEREMGHSLADEFETAGIPLTAAKNDRVAAGFAIQEHLNAKMPDSLPKLQISETGCPTLIKALRAMRVDRKHPGRIADHRMDHLPICLGYFCMAGVGPTQIPHQPSVPAWMVPKKGAHRVLGADNVRYSGHNTR